jgi:hypothetical protein
VVIKIASQTYTVNKGSYRWQVTVTESNRNIASNCTTLTFTMKMIKTAANSSSYNNNYCSYVQFVINGGNYGSQTVTFDLRKSSIGASKTLASKSVTIYHNSDGKKTISFSILHATKISFGDIYVSGNFTLTPIPRASSLTGYSTNTLNIGAQAWVRIAAQTSEARHDIHMRTDNSGWVNIGKQLTAGDHNLTIPSNFYSYVSKQQTRQAYLRIQTIVGGQVIGDQYSIQAFKVFNPNYDLNINSFYIRSDTYNEGGQYIAKETSFRTYLSVSGTLNISSVKYEVRGANYQDATIWNPSKYHYWDSAVMQNIGATSITAVVTDTAGHVTRKTINATLYDDSELKIHSITPSGTTDNTGAFAVTKSVTFNIKHSASKSRINRCYYRINNDYNRSVSSWNQTQGSFSYKFPSAGVWNVTVLIYDQYNNTASKTIQVCIDESRGDLKITSMYANGYLDTQTLI